MKIWTILLVILLIVSCGKKDDTSDQDAKAEKVMKEEIEKDNYMELGNKIVSETFAELSTELQTSMKNKGITEAISYCNVNALPITAKMESQFGVSIKRAGTKVRNPRNNPDNLENEVIKIFTKASEAGRTNEPVLMKIDNRYHFFKEIKIMPLCLNCHGSIDSDIKPETLKKIVSLYPDDKAVGYKAGELRGIWHITF